MFLEWKSAFIKIWFGQTTKEINYHLIPQPSFANRIPTVASAAVATAAATIAATSAGAAAAATTGPKE